MIGGFVFLGWVLVSVAIPFYMNMENSLVGLLLAAVIFWSGYSLWKTYNTGSKAGTYDRNSSTWIQTR